MIREKSCCIRQTDRQTELVCSLSWLIHGVISSSGQIWIPQVVNAQQHRNSLAALLLFYAFKRVTIVYFTCFACSCSGNFTDLFYWRKVLKSGKYSFFSELSFKERSICSWGWLKVCPVRLEIEKLTCFVRVHLRFAPTQHVSSVSVFAIWYLRNKITFHHIWLQM